MIRQDGACLFKPKKDFICVLLLQNVATGLYLNDFNVMVFFELTHLIIKAIIIVIVSIKHYINSFIDIFQTMKQSLVNGYYPSFSHCKWYS